MTQIDRIWPLTAIQPHRRVSRPDFRAEFLRLHSRPGGQRETGDAGGKSEIILDSRARSRLTAGRAGLEYQNIEPLGSGVDGRGQP